MVKVPAVPPTVTCWHQAEPRRVLIPTGGVFVEIATVPIQVLEWPTVGTVRLPLAPKVRSLSADTTGFNNITVSVDINATGQAERNLAIEYTLNDSVANPTWLNATITSAGSQGTLVNNSSSPLTILGNYVQLSAAGTGWNNQITASLPGAGSDPNFAVEIVNASTGVDNVNTGGTALNNSSGNWRYDNVIISGTTVPEPSTMALAGLGLAGLLAYRQRNRKA